VAGFELTSEAFEAGARIPERHTCDGEDVSPHLAWSAPPDGTRALALIMDDPDAPMGTFTHWVAWELDPAGNGLEEGEAPPSEGRNDFGNRGYGGPCPPPGGPHRYFFRLHALDLEPPVEAGAGRKQLEAAIEGHVLGTAELMGTYERG
jgi:Raf kinase inhibitor-like YbhB/YbcL family protein